MATQHRLAIQEVHLGWGGPGGHHRLELRHRLRQGWLRGAELPGSHGSRGSGARGFVPCGAVHQQRGADEAGGVVQRGIVPRCVSDRPSYRTRVPWTRRLQGRPQVRVSYFLNRPLLRVVV